MNRVDALKCGLPWADGVSITPLPESGKPAYLEALVADATERGATIANAGGGERSGALVRPAVLYPVDLSMRVAHEEQFGPVVPVATFRNLADVLQYVKDSPFGQQAAIFTEDAATAARFVDAVSAQVGRVNVNAQCARGPDQAPFSGRRSSALGTLSVDIALDVFSIPTVVAGPVAQRELLEGAAKLSRFLE